MINIIILLKMFFSPLETSVGPNQSLLQADFGLQASLRASLILFV